MASGPASGARLPLRVPLLTGSCPPFPPARFFRPWFCLLPSVLTLCLSFVPASAQPRAVSDLLALANAGDAEAQYELAGEYRWGEVVPVDLIRAFSWYQAAAEQGHAPALFAVAVMLEDGVGVDSDPATGLAFLRIAASAGHSPAACRLAAAYAAGRGLPRSFTEAYFWSQVGTLRAGSSPRAGCPRASDWYRDALQPVEVRAVQARLRLWRPVPPAARP